MPTVTGPPVTHDGTAVSGALVVVINNDTGEPLDWTTTDASGNWTTTVGGGQMVQPLIKYRDANGNLHQEYNKPYVVTESTILGEATNRWDFDSADAGTTIVADQIGTADISITGATWIASGYLGNGLDFDGVDDTAATQTGIMSNAEESFAMLGRGIDPSTTDGTIAAHGRAWAYGDLNYALSSRTSYISNPGETQLRDYRWSQAVTTFQSGAATATDWHLYSLSVDDTGTTNTAELYVDGTQVASGAGASYTGDQSAPIHLGSNPSPGHFANVDISFAIRYNRRLTPTEHSDLSTQVHADVVQ